MAGEPNSQLGPIHIDDDVQWLTEQIQALKRLGKHNEVDPCEKYDFSIRWGTALAGRLPRLVHYSSRGLLDEADQRRFQELCDELRGLSELIDRIGLVQPVFDDSALKKTRRQREPKTATSRRARAFRRR